MHTAEDRHRFGLQMQKHHALTREVTFPVSTVLGQLEYSACV